MSFVPPSIFCSACFSISRSKTSSEAIQACNRLQITALGSLPWVLRVVCLQSVISGIEVATIPLIGDKGRWLYVPSSASGPLAHAQWFISYPWIVNCNLALSLLFSVQCYCLSSSNGNVKGNSCIISWTFSTASLFFLFQCWIFTRKKVTVWLKTH